MGSKEREKGGVTHPERKTCAEQELKEVWDGRWEKEQRRGQSQVWVDGWARSEAKEMDSSVDK